MSRCGLKRAAAKRSKYRDVCVGVGDGKSSGVHDVAGHRHGAGDSGAKAGAVGAQHGEVLRHVWGVASVDADAWEFADVELEGVAVQGGVVQSTLCERCLGSRRVLNERGRWVLENKPEFALDKQFP